MKNYPMQNTVLILNGIHFGNNIGSPITKQSSGRGETIDRQSTGSCQAVVRQLSGSSRTISEQSSRSQIYQYYCATFETESLFITYIHLQY